MSRIATASIGTPVAFSRISCGASAMHGTHQLAKTLSSRGSPLPNVGARQRRACSGSIGGSANAGSGLPTIAERTMRSAGGNSPLATTASNSGERDERQPDQPALHAHASRSAARRSRRSRPTSDSAPPSAISTPPSQINVTNGFHHSRSCQRPCPSGWPSTV